MHALSIASLSRAYFTTLALAAASATVLAQPVITSVTPPTASPGMPVIIEGSGFSESSALNLVAFGGVEALVAYPASPNVLIATVPTGAGPGLSVTFEGLTGTFPFIVASTPSPSETDQNIIAIQGGSGDYPADLAIASTLSPQLLVTIDPQQPPISTVEVYLILENSITPIDVSVSFGLSDAIRTASAAVPASLGNNVLIVVLNGARSYFAQMLNFTPDDVMTHAPIDMNRATTDVAERLYHEYTLLVDFGPSATDSDISAALQAFDLRPMGHVQDTDDPLRPKLVIADTLLRTRLTGEATATIENAINTSPPAQVEAAVVNLALEDERVAGETMPARLQNGAAPNAGEGFRAADGGFDNDGNIANTNNDGDFMPPPAAPGTPRIDEDPSEQIDNDGDRLINEDPLNGLDDDGDGLIDEDPAEPLVDDDVDLRTDEDGPEPSDELDIAFPHFYMQTYAAHRLRDVVFGAAATPAVGIAVMDTGFGAGNVAGMGDIALARMAIGGGNHGWSVDGAVTARTIANLQDSAPPRDHGTGVTHVAAGDGTTAVLGTGKDAHVFIYQRRTVPAIPNTPANQGINFSTVAARAINHAARHIAPAGQPQVIEVANFSAGVRPNAWPALTPAQQAAINANFRAALNTFDQAGKIFVKSAGNEARVGPTVPGNLAPNRGGRHAGGATLARMVVAGGTNVMNAPEGPEELYLDRPHIPGVVNGAGTHTGPQIHVTAQCGRDALYMRPDGNLELGQGTSYSAPLVAGLLAEMIQLEQALRPIALDDPATPGVDEAAAPRRPRNLRMVEMVEATADDLGHRVILNGAGNRVGPGTMPNNDPGNGPDNLFGHGRINCWKAILAVVNNGIATQPGRAPIGGGNNNDANFRSVPLRDDAGTTWYGFEIVTSERGATAWIDGTQVADAGANMPNAPNITAYKGVRSNRPHSRGVHIQQDGSFGGDAAGANSVTDDDPFTGIVPVGTRVNERGQFVMLFSIERADLYNGAQPRTLSLRRRGETVAAKPFFNLRLETAKMRSGEVSGVTFDDFVFQITAPDYGDAAIAPTKMNAENGARHLNTALEWLGRPGATNTKSVSAEHNVETEATGGDAAVDVDGVTNRRGFHDRDGRDDGVIFFPLTYSPGNTGKVQFQIGVADAGDTVRYDGAEDRSVYFNLWVDWNADGVWSENPADNEHPLNGVRIRPRDLNTWIVVNSGTSGATVNAIASADNNVGRFECTNLPVGIMGCDVIWARARVDYGENVGRNDPRPLFRSYPSLRDPAALEADANPGANRGLVRGAARYGEVEDYLISVDVGDAPDQVGLGMYPTLITNGGAAHLTNHMEWMGPANVNFPNVSRESDADEENVACGGENFVFGSDEDGRPNLDPENTDLYDDGFAIHTCQPSGGPTVAIDITVTSSISARGGFHFFFPDGAVGVPEDIADSLPRYVDILPERMLYLSGWADWNGDGMWDNAEKIIDDTVNPMLFGGDGQYTLGEPFTDSNQNGVRDLNEPFLDVFGIDSQTRRYNVTHPTPGEGIPDKVWFRFRLAYGENDNEVDLGVKEADATGRDLTQDIGTALFGEVEDHVFERVEHDACSDPREVGEGVFDFDTRGALYDGHTGGCGGIGPDLWFVYTPECTGRAFITTCSNFTTFDTVLDVWSTDACPPAPVATVCNDDDSACVLNGNASSVIVPNVIAGQRYLIRVAGFGGACGTGKLTIRCKAAGPRLYVNHAVVGGNASGDSWANAISDLQTALAIARDSFDPNEPCLNVDEIWVASGTYLPSSIGDRDSSFRMISGVSIYGGFVGNEAALNQRNILGNPTILSGDLDGDDGANFVNNAENSYHVVLAHDVGPVECDDGSGNLIRRPALLDGFFVRSGNADGNATNDVGANIDIQRASAEIRNCYIHSGSAEKNGGGVFIYCDPNSQPIIARCAIYDNRVVGAIAAAGGGGLYAERPGGGYVVNTRIENNRAAASFGGGVLVADGPSVTIANCVIVDNQAVVGGGVGVARANTSTVRNCTIHRNTATNAGGGAYVFDAVSPGNLLMFANTILWDNTANGVANAMAVAATVAANPSIDYCDVEGGQAGITLIGAALVAYGVNNINANPLLAGNGNIPGNSPCVNAGSNAALPADAADLDDDGNTNEALPFDIQDGQRIRNMTVEIGAFEVVQAAQNNNCPNAMPVGNGRTNFDTSGATTDGPLSCGTMTNDIWFCYTATCTARLSISLCGSNFDTALAVYAGCACPALTQLACNDNCCASGSFVTLDVVAGSTYLIQVGGANGATGAGVMDITCQPATPIRYVNEAATGLNNGTTWANAYTDLQTALQVAGCALGTPQQIWVAAGTYRPAASGASRSATFQMIDNVAIYGGFAGFETSVAQRDIPSNPTILSGDLAGNDSPGFGNIAENVYHVVTSSGTGPSALLDGFIIQGGNADGPGSDAIGGGLLGISGSPVIRNCRITANSAVFGGVHFRFGSTPLLVDCDIDGNRAVGPSNDGAGAGLTLFTNSSATLVNCRIRNNIAEQCGGGFATSVNSNALFVNTLVMDNQGEFGAGGCIFQSAPTFVNVTFTGNDAGQFGGGLYLYESNVSLTNAILWDNTSPNGPQVALRVCPSSMGVNYSNLEGGQAAVLVNPGCTLNWGTGNLSVNPLLDAAGALSPGSPSIDAANNTAVPPDGADLDGDGNIAERTPLDLARLARFFNDPGRPDTGVGPAPVIDMGAFEFQGSSPAPCTGDLDHDGDVDLSDLAIMLSNFGVASGATFEQGDIDGDGDVDIADLALLLSVFGTICPAP